MKKTTVFRPIGGAVTALLDPLLAKRSHVDAALALAWPELAGEKLAGRTQPLNVVWPMRKALDDPFQPGTLSVACEGAVALDLQYRTTELIQRINRFFGYAAISKIRIEQRAIDQFRPKKRIERPILVEDDRKKLEIQVDSINSDGLREALFRLGESIKIEKNLKK